MTIPGGKQVAATTALFSDTFEPGLYKASAGTNTFAFAVNLDPAESRTVPLAEDEFERMGLPVQRPSAKNEIPSQKTEAKLLAGDLEQHQKLWRWGVVVCPFLAKH